MRDAVAVLLWYCHAHRLFVEMVTLVTAIAIAFPLILIRIFSGPRAAWAGWLGAAVAVFAPLYVVRMLEPSFGPNDRRISFGLALCSALSNWCFLEATWRLQRTDRMPPRWRAGLGAALGGLVALSLVGKELPVLYRAMDTAVSVACIYAIARALVVNAGTRAAKPRDPDRAFGPGTPTLVVRCLARGAAIVSVSTYVFAYLVYALHPLFTNGAPPLELPGRPSIPLFEAWKALCFAIALPSKSLLGFVALVVAVSDALYLGIFDRHQIYWAEEGPGDPILGLVRIANAQLFPATTVLVWSAPGSLEHNLVFELPPSDSANQLDAQEVSDYLDGQWTGPPERPCAPLGDFIGPPWKPVLRRFDEFPAIHGGVQIGRLLVKNKGRSLTTVERHRIEKFMLELVPALQARIEKDLLDVMTQQFAQTQGRDVRKVASTIVDSLARLFAPSRVRLNIDKGFVPFEEHAVSDPLGSEAPITVTCPLEISEGRSFGRATLTIPAPLRADHAAFFLVHREPILASLGRLLSARLLDALRAELDDHLDVLQDALAGADTTDGVLHLVNKALGSFGLSVSGVDVEPSPPPGPVALGVDGQTPLSSSSRRIKLTSLTAGCCLSLPVSGPLSWIVRLTVRREISSRELDVGTPWRAFLDRLQQLLGSALTRVHTAREVRDLQRVAGVAVSTGLIVHQMVNLTLAVSTTAEALHEETCLGGLPVEDPDLRRLLAKHATSAKELHSLVHDLHTYSAFTAERPVRLAKVLDRIERMFRSALLVRGVELRVVCAQDIAGAHLDVPFHIAGLALANLIENAKAAIEGGGQIVIEVSRCHEAIRCDVRDSGAGVAEALRERIFEMGVSTKPGSGGWGLYLTRKSLSEFGATVTLAFTGPAGSTFTLTLPEKKSC